MTQPNELAFARPYSKVVDHGIPEEFSQQDGLTKREYFAAMAMQGMLANNAEGNTQWNYDIIAQHCCKAADALIEQLNKQP